MTENENKFGAELNGTHYGLVELKHSADDNELNARELAEKMNEWDSKQWAVFEYCDEDVTLVDDISDLDIDTDEFDINGETILCLTDSEADDALEEELDRYLEDCIYPEIPEFCRKYFDEERWKDDCRNYDGRGQCIARYDGNENEIKVDDEWFYIYIKSENISMKNILRKILKSGLKSLLLKIMALLKLKSLVGTLKN